MKQKLNVAEQNSAIYKEGFTLIELLIVISIIGLLASIIVTSLNGARSKARDAFRKASLKEIQTALELYYNDNNAYPSTSGSWHGDSSAYGSYCYYDGCGGNGAYIAGLAPAYMSRLPAEPLHGQTSVSCGGTTNNGFLYYSDGTNYKVLSFCTPESTPLSTDAFYDPPRPTYAWQVSTPAVMNTW